MAGIRQRIYLKMNTNEKRLNKQLALDQAIRSNAGESYDDEGRRIVKANKIIKAAKKFETYLKGKQND